MIVRLVATLLLLGGLTGCGNIALAGNDSDATALAAKIMRGRLSDGFQARMQVAVTDSDKRIHPPFRIAVIGERKPGHQRLLVRGISPAKVRNRLFTAEAESDQLTTMTSVDGGNLSPVDPSTRLFDSGMVLWDLMTPWWRWPEQKIIGNSEVDGRECTLIRSRNGSRKAPVAEVISCVEQENLLPWRTELYGSDHKLLRIITVKRAIRTESGILAAKAMAIDLPGISSSDVQVYSGDEHYLITPATFALIENQRQSQAP